MSYNLPDYGGATLWIRGDDGSVPVAESCADVSDILDHARVNDERWCEFMLLADPNEDEPRRPCFVEPGEIIGMSFMSPESCDKLENEIN